jgi:hypothetical protein
MELTENLTQSKILFVNFMAEDNCIHLLKKLLGLAEVVSENLKVLILNMPPEVTAIDTYSYFARKLCQSFTLQGGEL